MTPATKTLLSRAYILGGSPCSGKSTIAAELSARHDLQYYKVDDHEEDHLARCNPERHPVMAQYAKMSWDEVWMRSVALQVEEEFAYYQERFEMILQDLELYDPEQPIVLEGAAYLPELVHRCEIAHEQVVYMVPTKAFQVQHDRQRPWIHRILEACREPERAFENWMARDHLFGREVLRPAKAYGYRTTLVDGQRSVDAQLEQIRELYFYGH